MGSAGDGLSTYSAPIVEDYGSLGELTAAFDPDLVMSVAKGLSLAVVSTAVVPGGGVLPGTESSPPTTGVMGESGTGGGSGGSGGALGERGSGGAGSGGAGSSSGGTAGVGGGGEGGSGAGGQLPFTGYSVLLTAAVGAALTSAGAGAKSALRRRRA